jgi:hypothetical protein
LLGERTGFREGLGGDGFQIAHVTRDFPEIGAFLDGYTVQRIAPSVLAYGLLQIIGAEPTNENIVSVFAVLDVLLVTGTAFVWSLTADALSLSRRGKNLGLAGLMLNWAVLKFIWFTPVLTDAPAMFVGGLSILLWLRGSVAGLVLATFAGAFIWPTQLLVGSLLLLFPRPDAEPRQSPRERLPRWLVPALFVSAATAIGVVGIQLQRTGFTIGNGTTETVAALMPLSIAFSAGFLALASAPILARTRELTSEIRVDMQLARRLGLVAALIITVKLVQMGIAQSPTRAFSTEDFLGRLVWTTTVLPGLFLVAHVSFFGPLVVVAVLAWRRTCDVIVALGPGLALVVLATIALSLFSESRTLFNVFPMVIPFVVKAVDTDQPSRLEAFIFIAAAILFSKIWLPLGSGFAHPEYLLSQGPWMTPEMYAIQGAAAMAIGFLLWFSRRLRTSAHSDRNGALSA